MFIDFELNGDGFRDRFHCTTVSGNDLLSSSQGSSFEVQMAGEGIVDKSESCCSAVYHSVGYWCVVDFTGDYEVCVNAFIAINNMTGSTDRKTGDAEWFLLFQAAVRPLPCHSSLTGAILPGRDT